MEEARTETNERIDPSPDAGAGHLWSDWGGEGGLCGPFLIRVWFRRFLFDPGVWLAFCGSAALMWLAVEHFLLAHVLVEGWSILVAFLILVIALQTRRYAQDTFVLILGVSHAAVAVIDFAHTLSYTGMGVLEVVSGREPAVQLWVSARYVQAASLVAAPLLYRRRVRMFPLVTVYGVVSGLVLLSVFHWRIFPACYEVSHGLTRFKVFSEYAVCVAFAVSGWLVYRNREGIGRRLAFAVLAAVSCTIVAELFFSAYTDFFGTEIILGHVFKAVSFYVLYRAVVVRGLHQPFELKESAERALSESRARAHRSLVFLNAALEATTDGLLIGDLNWHMLVCNGRFRQLCGVSDACSKGADIKEQLSGFSRALQNPGRLERRIAQMSNEPGASSFDVLLLNDGRIVECVTTPVRVDGRLSGRLWTFRDITRRRRVEEERNRLREVLAHATRVTTMGHLAGSIAHEITQPLAAMMVNSEAGLRMLDAGDVDPEEMQGLFQDIADDGRRAGEVIRRLRDFLRRRATSTGPFDLSAAVREVCDMLHAVIERRRVDLSLDLADSLPEVEGDRVQIQQVVLNLIMNAVEAVDSHKDPAAPRTLHVRSVQTADTVRVSVRDSGIGMGDDHEKAFDPFYSTKTNGLGVGLTISRSIIEGHGGKLCSTSVPTGGTEFHFDLPIP